MSYLHRRHGAAPCRGIARPPPAPRKPFMINPSIFSRNCSAILTSSLRSGSMGWGNMIMLDSRVATTPPVPPLRRGSAEHRSCSFPEARLLAFTVGRAPPTRHWFESLSRCRDVSTQVELLEPKSDRWHRGLVPRRLHRPLVA